MSYKVLLISTYLHEKNFLALAQYPNIEFDIIDNPRLISSVDIGKYKYIYSPGILLPPAITERFSNTLFILGPHISVFPNPQICSAISYKKNVIYVQPSKWAHDVWAQNEICNGIQFKILPFGVDVEKFCPSLLKTAAGEPQQKKAFIYFKRRHPAELAAMKEFLESAGYQVCVFDYVKKYQEQHYINTLREPGIFGVWIGSHESQGFALEEALSCNVPLLVWNVTSMNQEHGGNLPDYPATTIPYWDERCGEHFTNYYELARIFPRFLQGIEEKKYSPRNYILENLTFEKCEKKFIDILTHKII